jgi:hypothetical protein
LLAVFRAVRTALHLPRGANQVNEDFLKMVQARGANAILLKRDVCKWSDVDAAVAR